MRTRQSMTWRNSGMCDAGMHDAGMHDAGSNTMNTMNTMTGENKRAVVLLAVFLILAVLCFRIWTLHVTSAHPKPDCQEYNADADFCQDRPDMTPERLDACVELVHKLFETEGLRTLLIQRLKNKLY